MRKNLNPGLIAASAIAIYAAIISTLSLILAIRVYRVGGPKVSLDWEYWERDRNLVVSILNTGRADVTIASMDLYIVREEVTHRSPSGAYFNSHYETIGCIPQKLWYMKNRAVTFPARLASNSILSMRVKSEAITLPPQYSLDEISLRFVANFPNGAEIVYFRGDVLRHFVGIDPDRPVTYPSPGALPME